MEDDLTFGASVWGNNPTLTSASLAKPPISLSTTILQAPGSEEFGDSSFEDFEEFNTAPTSVVDGADDFGDFEEFGEAADVTANFSDHTFSSDVPLQEWHALRLDPLPERARLAEEIQNILNIIWVDENISRVTTDDPIREAEGIAQILTTPERWVTRSLDSRIECYTMTVGKCTKSYYKHLHP
jgi:hypothetical protein